MDISIVVPLFNEDESLPHLAEWIDRVMRDHGFSYEVIMVDDGSKDNSWHVIEQLRANNPCYKGVKFRRNYGKSAALNVGFAHAQGDVVITMDADLQDSPDEVPELFRMVKEDGYDLVSGWKKKRYVSKLDSWFGSKGFASIGLICNGCDCCFGDICGIDLEVDQSLTSEVTFTYVRNCRGTNVNIIAVDN